MSDQKIQLPAVTYVYPVSCSARPGDRRQQDKWVPYERRMSTQERRRRVRRAVDSPGRRQNPQPPLGVDIWV